MIPLLLFLLAIAAVYVGCVETAFSALMRLSLRLMAERGGRDDRLGRYLNDPLHLFVPARVLSGMCVILAAVLIAPLTHVDSVRALLTLLLALLLFVVVF